MSALPIGQMARPLTLQELENQYVVKVFKDCKGNIVKTAQVLGVGRATVYRKVYKLKLGGLL